MELFSQIVVMQWLGTAFGVVQVLMARQNNVYNYLFGIVAILISIYVLYQSQLYADILLNLYWVNNSKRLPSPTPIEGNMLWLQVLYWVALS